MSEESHWIRHMPAELSVTSLVVAHSNGLGKNVEEGHC